MLSFGDLMPRITSPTRESCCDDVVKPW